MKLSEFLTTKQCGDLCPNAPLLLKADATISRERQVFFDASLEYVFKIQEVQERKKFEFVEPVS